MDSTHIEKTTRTKEIIMKIINELARMVTESIKKEEKYRP